MKKVLLVNYTGRKGGGPAAALGMTKALVAKGIPVIAILSDQIENLNMWKKIGLESIITISTYHNKFDAAISTLLFPFIQRKAIQKQIHEYDVIYIYCPMGALWTKRINRLFPHASVGLVIHDPIPHSGEERLSIRKDTKKGYDYLFVHSQIFVEPVKEKYKKPTFYLQMGHHDIYKECENKMEIVQYNPNKINFVFFGRISKYKGLDVLAKAYETVSKELNYRCSLTIVGSGDFTPYEHEYEKLINVTIINRWIKDEETESVFTGANVVCICPYVDATQSGVALVAMDYCVPIIASNTGGIAEQIDDEVTGLLVSPSDPKALADAMLRLANDENLRKAISHNQEIHMSLMGWDVSADQLINAMNISF